MSTITEIDMENSSHPPSEKSFQQMNPMYFKNESSLPPLKNPNFDIENNTKFRDENPQQSYKSYQSMARTETTQAASVVTVDKNLSTIFAVVHVTARKLILVDNVLGLHLPLFQVCFDNFYLTFLANKTL